MVKKKYDCEIIAVCCDAGQKEDYVALEKKAYATGASKSYILNIQKEFITDYIWPTLKAGAVYENDYLLDTSMARPLMAKKLVEVAEKEGAMIIAPWRTWDLCSRKECIDYAKDHNIPIAQTVEKIYSRDENIWHISHEGGNLENPVSYTHLTLPTNREV